MSNEYVVDESPQFLVECNGIEYAAIVRYYSNGDCDIELINNINLDGDCNPTSNVYDAAWEKAEELGLIETDSDGDYGDSV